MSAPSGAPKPILFVFLGASNLARGHRALARCLEASLHPRPVRFLYALGPGRGYCAWAGFLNKVYPPISGSPIFDAIRRQAATSAGVVALVSDIGNDIMFDIPAETITEKLRHIFRQFLELDARALVTPIPSFFETELGRRSFLFLRALFYPKSKVTHEQAVSAVRTINRFLEKSANENISLIDGLDPFIGWDKIHYSVLKNHLAWSRIAKKILEELGENRAAGISFPRMLESYGACLAQLIAADLLSLKSRGPEYF
ncbi:MAG: hypothetical protein ACE5GQ_00560 [Nitrospinales bacterium]